MWRAPGIYQCQDVQIGAGLNLVADSGIAAGEGQLVLSKLADRMMLKHNGISDLPKVILFWRKEI